VRLVRRRDATIGMTTGGIVKYLLLICMEEPPAAPLETPEEIASWDEPAADVQPWLDETAERRTRLFGSQVSRPANAATVRVRDGETLITDGPYAETKEWMAGFDVLECADMTEAIEIAARHPVAEFGLIEIRPFRPGTGRQPG
jgi:hypothetical protein